MSVSDLIGAILWAMAESDHSQTPPPEKKAGTARLGSLASIDEDTKEEDRVTSEDLQQSNHADVQQTNHADLQMMRI